MFRNPALADPLQLEPSTTTGLARGSSRSVQFHGLQWRLSRMALLKYARDVESRSALVFAAVALAGGSLATRMA
jgi:hypothetical protein